MSFLCESSFAELAREGPLAGVHAQMHNQRLLLRETLQAVATLEGLVGRVHTAVLRQLLLIRERQEAHLALERGVGRVQAQVVHQLEFAIVSFITNAAGIPLSDVM